LINFSEYPTMSRFFAEVREFSYLGAVHAVITAIAQK
jgi:hypothetical protein